MTMTPAQTRYRSRRRGGLSVALRRRKASVVIIVLWTISIAAIMTAGIQLFSYRQSTLGRETLERVQSRWAARAGVEYAIAVMEYHTREPVTDDAFAMPLDMARVAYGELIGASYDVQHHANGRNWYGPMDEHSKLNVNSANMVMLMALDNMWIDIADAIMSWINPDHQGDGLSVTRDYYLSLQPPYEPRNGPVQNIAELELVAGVWPRYLRGEDWNLNGRLDPNEDDSGVTFPPDNGDGILDAGWSGLLTAYSVAGGATGTGKPRLELGKAKIAEVRERLGVDDLQARALIRYGRNRENQLNNILVTPISHIGAAGEVLPQPYNPEIPDLTDKQLQGVLDEFSMTDPTERRPGRMNINTVVPRLLRDLLEFYGFEPMVADEILYLRDARPEGITSLLELRSIPDLDDESLLNLADLFTTRSNVYQVSSLGRSSSTGLEVEIIAVVDRSTIPARILEYREQ